MTVRTPNFGFELVPFNNRPWHQKEHDNWRLVDAVFSRYLAISGLSGVWQTSTAYTTGQSLVDEELGSIFVCLLDHVSAAAGTFEEARADNPILWAGLEIQVANRGTYTLGVSYAPNDFVVDAHRYGIVSQGHVATTYNEAVTASKIITLIDLTTDLATSAALVVAAGVAASAAAASATLAQASVGAVKVSVADTTAAPLSTSLASTGGTVTFSITNPGANEVLNLEVAAVPVNDSTFTGQLSIAKGGTGAATASAAFTALKQGASDTVTGVVELATPAEVVTGSDTARACTPQGVASVTIGRLLRRNVITASGVGTWTKGTSTRFINVRLRGGGGAGGGANSATTAGGSGGGQGGYAEEFLDVTADASITYTIGAGGAGVSNGTGATGGTTQLDNSAVRVQATGGTGGGANGGIPGTAGVGSLGDFNLSGQAGFFAPLITFDGVNNLSYGGPGGGESGGKITTTVGAGNAGTLGGGGAGALDAAAASRTGGAGGAGWMIIDEYS